MLLVFPLLLSVDQPTDHDRLQRELVHGLNQHLVQLWCRVNVRRVRMPVGADVKPQFRESRVHGTHQACSGEKVLHALKLDSEGYKVFL